MSTFAEEAAAEARRAEAELEAEREAEEAELAATNEGGDS